MVSVSFKHIYFHNSIQHINNMSTFAFLCIANFNIIVCGLALDIDFRCGFINTILSIAGSLLLQLNVCKGDSLNYLGQ